MPCETHAHEHTFLLTAFLMLLLLLRLLLPLLYINRGRGCGHSIEEDNVEGVHVGHGAQVVDDAAVVVGQERVGV